VALEEDLLRDGVALARGRDLAANVQFDYDGSGAFPQL